MINKLLPVLIALLLYSCNNDSLLNNVEYTDVLKLESRSEDAKITYGNDPLQYGLLWLPQNKSKQQLIIYVHSGCWLNAYDLRHSRRLSSELSERGYAVWSLEYRRTGDKGGGWPGTLDDIILSINSTDKLTNELKPYTINVEQPIIVGHSAGGHLALLAGGRLPKQVKAIIGLAAIVDIEEYSKGDNSCQMATAQFMGGNVEQLAELYKQANPVKQPLHSNSLLLYGTADKIVPEQQAIDSKIDATSVKGAGHFDWIHPNTKAFNQLIIQLRNF